MFSLYFWHYEIILSILENRKKKGSVVSLYFILFRLIKVIFDPNSTKWIVISNDPLKSGMSNSQRHPLNIFLIINAEDIVHEMGLVWMLIMFDALKIDSKELSFCHKLWFFKSLYLCHSPLIFQTVNYVRSNNLTLKY